MNIYAAGKQSLQSGMQKQRSKGIGGQRNMCSRCSAHSCARGNECKLSVEMASHELRLRGQALLMMRKHIERQISKSLFAGWKKVTVATKMLVARFATSKVIGFQE